jgi:multiple sugar transport system permease protein
MAPTLPGGESPTAIAGLHEPAPARLRRRRPRTGRVVAWAVLLLIVVITVFPIYWMIRTAFSTTNALAAGADSLIPADPTLGAFERVFGSQSTEEALAQGGTGSAIRFWLYLRNSVIASSLITAGQVACCALAAYAFARLRFKGRNTLFLVMLSALMVPAIFITLPNFVLIKDLHWIGTFQGIVAPTFFFAPFSLFFLRQFFLGIPREVEEAAMLDGAGHFRILWRVVMPMAAAPLATLAILTYIEAWNQYLWPYLVGRENPGATVLTVGLAIFRSQNAGTDPDWAGLMAGTTVAALPVLFIFLVFGRRLINSIQFSGIK